jgi:hypothetical protein
MPNPARLLAEYQKQEKRGSAASPAGLPETLTASAHGMDSEPPVSGNFSDAGSDSMSEVEFTMNNTSYRLMRHAVIAALADQNLGRRAGMWSR